MLSIKKLLAKILESFNERGRSITAYVSANTTLTTSRKQMPLTARTNNGGGVLSLSGNTITVLKSGYIGVSIQHYANGLTASDTVQSYASINGVNGTIICAAYGRDAGSTTNAGVSAFVVRSVSAGNKIYFSAVNWAGARGSIQSSELSTITVIWIRGQ